MSAPLDLGLVVISLRGLDATRATLASVAKHLPLGEDANTMAIFGAQSAEEADPEYLVGLGIAFQAVEDTLELQVALGNALDVFTSPWVVILSDDIALTEGWFEPLVAYVTEHPDAVVVTPSIMIDGRETVSGEPALGDRVCVLVNREALAADKPIGNVVQVNESRVELAGALA